MKYRLILNLFLVISLLIFAITNLNAQNRKPTDSLIFTKFYSKILSEERRLIVHLPLNYLKEPKKKYPVVYVLDGGNQDVHTSDYISVLSKSNLLPECIVVGILNTKTSRNRDQTPPFMQTETGDNNSPFGQADHFLEFIEKEIIPKIDSNYRSNSNRSLSGHSRAGLFVLYSLIEKPNLFDARFCYSTPVWRFNDLIITKTVSFLKTQKLQAKTFLFMSVGNNETENIIGGFNRFNASIIGVQKSLVYQSYLTPFANHQENPLVATPKGLYEWAKYLTENKKAFN